MSYVETLEDHGSHDVGESTDFVQSHVDSFFPPSEEVIEEEPSEKIDEPNSDHHVDITVDFQELASGKRRNYAVIPANVMDTAGIEKVVIEVTDRNNKVTLYREDAEELDGGWLRFETTIDISYSSDYLTSYKVKVKAVDVNDNSFVTKEKVNGVFGGVISAIVDAVAGFLADAWEAAKGLANAFADLIKNKVKSLIGDIIDPIKSKIEGWASDVNTLLTQAIDEYNENGDVSESTLQQINELFKYLYITVFAAATAIVVGLNAIMILSGGVGSLSSLVIPICLAIIMTQLFNSDRTSGMDLEGVSSSMGIDAILDFGKNLIESKSSKTDSLNNLLENGKNDLDDFWGGIGALVGWGSFLFGVVAIEMASVDISGNLGAIWGISAALLGVALGIAALLVPGAIGYMALIFGIESCVLSLITFAQIDGIGGAKIAAGLSFALGVVSSYLSLKSLDLVP